MEACFGEGWSAFGSCRKDLWSRDQPCRLNACNRAFARSLPSNRAIYFWRRRLFPASWPFENRRGCDRSQLEPC